MLTSLKNRIIFLFEFDNDLINPTESDFKTISSGRSARRFDNFLTAIFNFAGGMRYLVMDLFCKSNVNIVSTGSRISDSNW